jgi:hypothetical protein
VVDKVENEVMKIEVKKSRIVKPKKKLIKEAVAN